jgi:hypothetical protein
MHRQSSLVRISSIFSSWWKVSTSHHELHNIYFCVMLRAHLRLIFGPSPASIAGEVPICSEEASAPRFPHPKYMRNATIGPHCFLLCRTDKMVSIVKICSLVCSKARRRLKSIALRLYFLHIKLLFFNFGILYIIAASSDLPRKRSQTI